MVYFVVDRVAPLGLSEMGPCEHHRVSYTPVRMAAEKHKHKDKVDSVKSDKIDSDSGFVPRSLFFENDVTKTSTSSSSRQIKKKVQQSKASKTVKANKVKPNATYGDVTPIRSRSRSKGRKTKATLVKSGVWFWFLSMVLALNSGMSPRHRCRSSSANRSHRT